MSRHSISYWLLAMAAVSAILASCAQWDQLIMGSQLRKADDALVRGEYALAAARYESIRDEYPHSPQHEKLMINQGSALYHEGSYHDARSLFLEYIKEYPSGSHRRDAETYLLKIDALMTPNPAAEKAVVEANKADLNKLQELRLAHPHDPAVIYALGNKYWEMGDMTEAVRYYTLALELDATYQEKTLIQDRMMIDETGKPTPITPERLKMIERERRPVVVFDTHTYRSRDRVDYRPLGTEAFYNVTGKVRNQSSRLVHEIVLEVRFLDKLHQVLDVAFVPIGSMGPGEVRAFRAEATSYDNLYNIDTYEVIPQAGF